MSYVVPNPLWQRVVYRRLIKNSVFIDPDVDVQRSEIEPYAALVRGAQVINSHIGAYSSIGRNSVVIDARVGKFCSVSWNVTIGATNHPYDTVTTHAFPYFARIGFTGEDRLQTRTTVLGHDVWIGCNSVIMPGVKVGHGAVIGAGAIVTADVPDYAVAAGTPAKVLKPRFDREIADRLLALRWWDFPVHTLKEHVGLFQRQVDRPLLDELEKLKDVQV